MLISPRDSSSCKGGGRAEVSKEGTPPAGVREHSDDDNRLRVRHRKGCSNAWTPPASRERGAHDLQLLDQQHMGAPSSRSCAGSGA